MIFASKLSRCPFPHAFFSYYSHDGPSVSQNIRLLHLYHIYVPLFSVKECRLESQSARLMRALVIRVSGVPNDVKDIRIDYVIAQFCHETS